MIDPFLLGIVAVSGVIVLVSLAIDALIRKIFKRKSFKEDRKVFAGLVLFFASAMVIVLFLPRDISEKNRHVGNARAKLQSVDRELFKYADGKEFNLESLPSFMRDRTKGIVRVYLEEKDIPADLKSLLKPEELPFVRKDAFRIIALGARKENAVLFVRTEQSKDEDVYSREIEFDLRKSTQVSQ